MEPSTEGASRRIRTFIIDDEPVTREGLRYGLAIDEDIEIVGEAGSAREAFRIIEPARPEVVVLDIVLPGMDGIAAARDLRQRVPAARVLVLTVHNRVHNALDALAAGATGFALKTEPLEALRAAVRLTAQGRQYIAPALAPAMAGPDAQSPQVLEPLSVREREVFQLVASGARISDAARELCISRKTVETHLGRVYRKLGCRSISELVRFAAIHDLLREDLTPRRAGGTVHLS